MVTVAAPKRRVAVVDDNPDYLDDNCHVVDIAGFEPVPMKGTYKTVQDLLKAIHDVNAYALVCDHKLTEGNYAGFEGVEAVAALYGSNTPALLVTDYADSDLRHSIQRRRRRVPVLIRGDDMTPSQVSHGIEVWEQEVMNNDMPVQRRPRRAVVMVDDVAPGGNWRTVTVFIPRWREHDAVSLSEELFPQDVRSELKKGKVLTALVNTEAERIEDLYFEDFRLTPDEDLTNEPA